MPSTKNVASAKGGIDMQVTRPKLTDAGELAAWFTSILSSEPCAWRDTTLATGVSTTGKVRGDFLATVSQGEIEVDGTTYKLSFDPHVVDWFEVHANET